ncbi:MAG: hypothetical protein ACO3YM_06735 [Candidatus Kapaibacteriota bacterium]
MIHRAMQISGMMFIMMLVGLSGCLFVWEEEEFYPAMALSPMPEIAMSEKTIESIDGDMVAFIPEGWYLLKQEFYPSKDVFAMAVDSTMTLTAVFSKLNKPAKDSNSLKNVNDMMRFALQQHIAKSQGSVQQVGKGRPLSIGRRTFGFISFGKSNTMSTKALVWRSNAGNLYECALVPLDMTSTPIPNDSMQTRIIRSIASMIMF